MTTLDVVRARLVPFTYVAPAVCDFIFSASGEVEIFLDTRRRPGFVTGVIISVFGTGYRIAWDTYPDALCYTIYKLVDELDPFSGYVLIAECVTDNFLDITDPGAYVVVAISEDGETPIPDTPTSTPPDNGCTGNQPPTGTGIDKYVCADAPTDIDVSANNADPEGGALTIVEASADQGSASSGGGLVITYEPPPGGMVGSAIVSYVVQDVCGATNSNTLLLRPYTDPEFTKPGQFRICDDEDLMLDVADYVDNVGAEESQEYVINSASLSGIGGSLVYGEGSGLIYTPNPEGFGDGSILFTAQNQCGIVFNGEFDVRVLCDTCVPTDDIVWSAVSGSPTFSSLTGSYLTFSMAAGGGQIGSGPYASPAPTTCTARIVFTRNNAAVSVFHNGSFVYSSGVGSTPIDTTFAFNLIAGNNQTTVTLSAGGGGNFVSGYLLINP